MREVEAFLAVARELHFGRAGDRLRLSTTRVSRLVRALEERLDAVLFDRSSRDVRLTDAGRRLFAELCPAHAWMARAITGVGEDPPANVSLLRVGFATTVSEAFSARQVKAFEAESPRWRVARYAFPSAEMLAWLHKTWPVDVFVTWLPGVEPRTLGIQGVRFGSVIDRAPRAVAVADTHPLAGRASVDIEELPDHEILAFVEVPEGLSRAWTPRTTPGGRPMSLRRVLGRTVEEAMWTVAGGDVGHLTFVGVDALYPRPGVSVVPVTGLPDMSLVAAWSADIDKARGQAAAEFSAAAWPTRTGPGAPA
ncbi:LysR family transcriptional regulator [Embleya sp. NPDC001921]